ncbi:hypothetical protein BH09ACT6_BH09ACT6_14870 [soil metagenome]
MASRADGRVAAEHPAVIRGQLTLTEAQLVGRVALRVREREAQATTTTTTTNHPAPGTIVPIIHPDPIETLVTALAVREGGGVPLIGDDRWAPEYWSRLRALAESAEPAPGLAWATFSSGSTGTPRVILRSGRSWSASFAAVSGLLGLTDSDMVYLPAPLASSMSLFSVAHARTAGAGILLPRGHTVTAADLEVATVVHCTPHALRAIIDAIDAGARHQLRAALVGGASLEPSLRRRAEARGLRVVSYYGAAEFSFVAFDDDGLGLRPFPGVETRVDTLESGIGELWVRSAYFAAGYRALGTPSDAGGSMRRAEHGWATVGDLVDDKPGGPLRFRGRRDGAILTAAATVIPEDVEAALRTIDGVDDAVVFGLPNAGAGSLVAALVETTPGPPRPTARELREQAESRVGLTHLPRRWYGTERLPRTTAGKPARAQIRTDALAGRLIRLD